jgi:hypothetical protein
MGKAESVWRETAYPFVDRLAVSEVEGGEDVLLAVLFRETGPGGGDGTIGGVEFAMVTSGRIEGGGDAKEGKEGFRSSGLDERFERGSRTYWHGAHYNSSTNPYPYKEERELRKLVVSPAESICPWSLPSGLALSSHLVHETITHLESSIHRRQLDWNAIVPLLVRQEIIVGFVVEDEDVLRRWQRLGSVALCFPGDGERERWEEGEEGKKETHIDRRDVRWKRRCWRFGRRSLESAVTGYGRNISLVVPSKDALCLVLSDELR